MRKRTAAVVCGLLLGLAGCGGPPPPPAEATGTLEELAARAGCVPDLDLDAAEIRQANCRTGASRYVLVAFATDRGRAEWLDQADDYGGTYLVARKWVAVADEPTLTSLRTHLGGTLHLSGEGAHGEHAEPGGHGGHASHAP
ncbi:hypothetical protein GCM10010329_13950 [Streptomyces spiroverticillatus]|uniref:Lipoprotein n=1 Tax=Streptomyces finlayi TaxID=67296 RepID=A0A918X2V4_9ACTN|nr:hypothetical protein [Streptomyces finlayi]GGZ93995.1 hypothetical protein GCM10010329_13950 [Streptomyces spiroverticillatus]GHD06473.1 hypothetical protein GCM10010334_57990 [Streptomyces finlayi]